MNTYKTTIIGSILIALISIWGIIETSYSPTAFIPLIIAILLLFCSKGIKEENKTIAHIGVMLALMCFAGLFMPLNSAMNDGDDMGILRVSIMLFSSGVILLSYINSFIQARRK